MPIPNEYEIASLHNVILTNYRVYFSAKAKNVEFISTLTKSIPLDSIDSCGVESTQKSPAWLIVATLLCLTGLFLDIETILRIILVLTSLSLAVFYFFFKRQTKLVIKSYGGETIIFFLSKKNFKKQDAIQIEEFTQFYELIIQQKMNLLYSQKIQKDLDKFSNLEG